MILVAVEAEDVGEETADMGEAETEVMGIETVATVGVEKEIMAAEIEDTGAEKVEVMAVEKVEATEAEKVEVMEAGKVGVMRTAVMEAEKVEVTEAVMKDVKVVDTVVVAVAEAVVVVVVEEVVEVASVINLKKEIAPMVTDVDSLMKCKFDKESRKKITTRNCQSMQGVKIVVATLFLFPLHGLGNCLLYRLILHLLLKSRARLLLPSLIKSFYSIPNCFHLCCAGNESRIFTTNRKTVFKP